MTTSAKTGRLCSRQRTRPGRAPPAQKAAEVRLAAAARPPEDRLQAIPERLLHGRRSDQAAARVAGQQAEVSFLISLTFIQNVDANRNHRSQSFESYRQLCAAQPGRKVHESDQKTELRETHANPSPVASARALRQRRHRHRQDRLGQNLRVHLAAPRARPRPGTAAADSRTRPGSSKAPSAWSCAPPASSVSRCSWRSSGMRSSTT